jgi:acetamidase/formamidase
MGVKHLRTGVSLFCRSAREPCSPRRHARRPGRRRGLRTAIETPWTILRLTVRRDFSIEAPQFHLPAGAKVEDARTSFHVCTGVGPDLMEASRDAVRATIAHLGDRYGLEREEAYAVASVAADLRIHEVVDAPNWVVGAFIPEAIFEGGS